MIVIMIMIIYGIVCGSCLDRVGIILGSFWDRVGIVLGSLWDHLGIVLDYVEIMLGSFGDNLGSFWYNLGIIWESFRDHLEIVLGPRWDRVGIVLGSVSAHPPPLTPIGRCLALDTPTQFLFTVQSCCKLCWGPNSGCLLGPVGHPVTGGMAAGSATQMSTPHLVS